MRCSCFSGFERVELRRPVHGRRVRDLDEVQGRRERTGNDVEREVLPTELLHQDGSQVPAQRPQRGEYNFIASIMSSAKSFVVVVFDHFDVYVRKFFLQTLEESIIKNSPTLGRDAEYSKTVSSITKAVLLKTFNLGCLVC